MTYFQKNKTNEWLPIVPLIVLPLAYKDSIEIHGDQKGVTFWRDEKNNFFTYESSFTLYTACWRLSSLLVADLIEEKLRYERDDLKLGQKFSSDIGADSLDLIEIVLALEKSLGIPVHEGLHFETVSDLVDYVFSIMIHRIQKINLSWGNNQNHLNLNW